MSHLGKQVVAWTPYGRRETVEILERYLARDHAAGIVDKWLLYMNTDFDQEGDRNYADELSATRDWIEQVPRPGHLEVMRPKQMNTGYFYRHAIEPDTVYVRFDDDIVYIHQDAVRRLVANRIADPRGALVAFPVIWHNAVCSFYLQQLGKIPRSYGTVGSAYCMDPVGWADGRFAEHLHHHLIDKIVNGQVDDLFVHHDIQLQLGLQFSVSCFAANSDVYTELNPPGHLGYHEEETWHTQLRPRELNRPNVIVGNALVAHLSFYPHSEFIRRRTDVLQWYHELSLKVR